ncbi:MAG: hypothetical protein M3433_03585 [Actinomycetota bacterium]|nr:hypothetical protein [Actinomycetota bacterium]
MGALLLFSPGASADQVLVSDPSPDHLSAYAGATAWSRLAGPRYRLVIRSNGRTEDARVRGFRHPVNADLGPARRRGRTVAVYARCKANKRDCDLFEYSLRDKRERKLWSISSRRRSEYAPSVWRGRYLFGRSATGLVKTGPLLRISRRKAIDTDLQGNSALYSYAGPNDGADVRTQRFERRRPGRACLIFQSSVPSAGGSFQGIGPVAIDGDFLFSLFRVFPPAGSGNQFALYSVERERKPTSRCARRSLTDRVGIRPQGDDPRHDDVTSFSISRGHLLYTDRGRGVVEVTPPPSFGPVAR